MLFWLPLASHPQHGYGCQLARSPSTCSWSIASRSIAKRSNILASRPLLLKLPNMSQKHKSQGCWRVSMGNARAPSSTSGPASRFGGRRTRHFASGRCWVPERPLRSPYLAEAVLSIGEIERDDLSPGQEL